MSDLLDPRTRLLELTSLPPGDPRRTQIDHELSLLPEAERARWLHVLNETDLLYDNLPQIDLPPDLHSRLLQIPTTAEAATPAPAAPVAKIRPASKRWRLYAAALLLLIPAAGIALWNMPQSETTRPNFTLDPAKANQVAAIAEQLHDAPPPLAITSSNPATVQSSLDTAMKSAAMPFPAMIPTPKSPLTLLGGGLCSFGTTHAAFTRWSSGTHTLTLYQFDGKPLHLPPAFDKALVSTAHGHYVSIWPGYGNPCTWALVADSKPTAQLFD